MGKNKHPLKAFGLVPKTRTRFIIWPLLVFLVLLACFIYSSDYASSSIFGSLQQKITLDYATTSGTKHEMTCNLYNGTWIRDYGGTIYSNMTCKSLPDSKNCEKYGKEHDIVKWRWRPHGCNLPRFDPELFLSTLKGMNLAFIGDSVAGNHMDSLLCMLSQVESPQNTYKDSENRNTKWHFKSYNFTILHLWTKFLVESKEIEVINSTSPETHLHLDQVDLNWANHLDQINYVIVSGGHWFFRQIYLYQNNQLIGSVFKSDKNIPNLGIVFSAQLAFRTTLNYLKNYTGTDLQLVVVRTFAPSHFENGKWNQGGSCDRTRPDLVSGPAGGIMEMRNAQIDEVERLQNVRFTAMDVTWAMVMRPDGHPGTHWDNKWNPGQSDCLHWCLPGAIDTWNELLFQTLQHVAN